MEKPLVSIHCPTYNAGKFIARTLESILGQSYQNIQIVISDDCSLDNTVDVVRDYIKKFPDKIHLSVNQKNLGVTTNCNLSLSMCNGKYIALFAGDDVMYPDKIEKQIELMEGNENCAMTYHSVDIVDGDNDGRIILTTEKNEQKYKSFIDVIKRGGIIGSNSIVIRRDALPAYGLSKKLPRVSDWLLHIEVALRGEIHKVPGVLASYTRHNKGESRKTFETLIEIFDTLTIIEQRFGFNKVIIDITKKAKKRYLLGEMIRLYQAGDSKRLRELNNLYIQDIKILISLYYLLKTLIFLRINKLELSDLLIHKLSTFSKS
jgi:glycosyltransferase involved in cell wall biosynthesis